jgi:hypothetical protein
VPRLAVLTAVWVRGAALPGYRLWLAVPGVPSVGRLGLGIPLRPLALPAATDAAVQGEALDKVGESLLIGTLPLGLPGAPSRTLL